MDGNTSTPNGVPVFSSAGKAPNARAALLLTLVSLAAAALSVIASALDAGIYTLIYLAAAGGLFAFVYLGTRSPLVFLLPVPTFAASLLLTSSPLKALAACSFAIPGFILARAVSKKYDRTQSVISVSAAMCVSYLLYMVINVALTYGGLGTEAFTAFYETETEAIRQTLNSLASSSGTESGSSVEYLVNYMLVMLPGDLICIMNITGYLTTLSLCLAAKIFGVGEIMLPDKPWKVSLSMVSTYVYCGAYLAAVFGKNVAPVSAVTTNLIMILTPGFALVGLQSLLSRLKTPRGRSAAVLYAVSAVILFLLNPLTIFLLAAFVGIFETFAERRRIRSKKSGDGE